MTKEETTISKVEETKKQETLAKNFSDVVINTIHDYVSNKRLQIPVNYSPENALKSAWLMIQNTVDKNGIPALTVCDKNRQSIANALLEMTIMGLNPAKSQCYFIVYGDKLTLMPSYFGKITALKRIKGVEDINAQVIYENDEISYKINSDGTVSDIEHIQEFKNIDEDKIVGGYCIIKYDGKEYATLANIKQVQEAWNMSKMTKSKTSFKSEFVKRTMINKAIKWFINTRDDQDLVIETVIANENQHYDYSDEEELPEQRTVAFEEKITEPKTVILEASIEGHNETKVDKFE